MKVRSTIIPSKYEIGERKGNLVEVAFFCDVEEVKNNEDEINYEYSMFKLMVVFRNDLEDSLNTYYDDWLALARNNDYQITANKVREKRNKLLEETDKHLLLDRIGLEIPKEVNSLSLLEVVRNLFSNLGDVLNGEWATYRQELRDITKQDGFPYDVEFPEKPEE